MNCENCLNLLNREEDTIYEVKIDPAVDGEESKIVCEPCAKAIMKRRREKCKSTSK